MRWKITMKKKINGKKQWKRTAKWWNDEELKYFLKQFFIT